MDHESEINIYTIQYNYYYYIFTVRQSFGYELGLCGSNKT